MRRSQRGCAEGDQASPLSDVASGPGDHCRRDSIMEKKMRAQTRFLFAAGPILAVALGFATLCQAAPLEAGVASAPIAHNSPAAEARIEKAHYTGHRHRHYHHRSHSHHRHHRG